MPDDSKSRKSLLDFNETVQAVNGKVIGFAGAGNNFYFNSVAADSRYVSEGSLFIPLIGQNQNGHEYIPEAAEKGASVIFINTDEYKKNPVKYMDMCSKYSNIVFLSVLDTLNALQETAACYVRKFPDLIKIGITGSSGKTTVKEMIVSILKEKYEIIYSKGNFNSETGLPLSVFNIRKEHQIGVFELGMNRYGEIGEISGILKPQYALITNIGSAHIGNLGSRRNIALEKRKIFDYIPKDGAAFIPASDSFSQLLCENVKGRVIKYGSCIFREENAIEFKKDFGEDGFAFEIDGTQINLPLPGIFNYINALAAVSVGKEFGLTPAQIKKGLESIKCIPGRMEVKKIISKCGVCITLIEDCYNANPESMMYALDFCAELKNIKKRIYVLGDMLELGEISEEEHKKIGIKAAKDNPAMIIFIGRYMKEAYKAAKDIGYENSVYIPCCSGEEIILAANLLIDFADEGDVILFKGSRFIALERIIPLIEKKKWR